MFITRLWRPPGETHRCIMSVCVCCCDPISLQIPLSCSDGWLLFTWHGFWLFFNTHTQVRSAHLDLPLSEWNLWSCDTEQEASQWNFSVEVCDFLCLWFWQSKVSEIYVLLRSWALRSLIRLQLEQWRNSRHDWVYAEPSIRLSSSGGNTAKP